MELAQRVISGDWGLGPGLYYVSPFYIYFLALVHGVTDSFTAIRIAQVVLGTVAIGFMFETARQWYGQRAALATAILAGLTGLFTFYEALILQTGVDVFLTSAALLCLTYALKKDDWRWILAAGVVFGIQTMNRPNIAIAIVLMLILLAALRRWKFAAALAAGLLIGIAPAAIRNAVVANEFSLLSSHGGLNFYIGNGEGATGFYRFIPGITPTIKGQANDVRVVAGTALGRTVTDAEASDYFMNLTWRWIESNPGSAAFLMIRKFGWVFHAQHVPLPYSYPFYQTEWPTLLRYLFIGPWILVPLGLVGLLFGRGPRSLVPGPRADTPFLIFASFVPAYAAAVALFFMSERYRLPLLVPLTIGAGGTVALFISYIEKKEWRRLAAPVGVAAVLLVAVNTRAMANDGKWEEGLRLAAQLVLQGRFDEADRWIEKLEANTKQPGNASGSIGIQLLLKNEPARALKHLETAAKFNPNKAGIEYALGQALLGVGRAEDAIRHLRFGYDNGATMPMTGYHLAIALKDVGRTAEAQAWLPKIKMTTESRVEDWLNAGRLGMELKAPDQAAPFFQQAVELAPGNAEARLQFGVALVVLKRFDDAARELTEAARLDPRSAPALAYLAYSEQQLGRLDAARMHLNAALAIDPNDPMARLLASIR